MGSVGVRVASAAVHCRLRRGGARGVKGGRNGAHAGQSEQPRFGRRSGDHPAPVRAIRDGRECGPAAVALRRWPGVGAAARAVSVLDAGSIPKYATSLVIPPAMPRSGNLHGKKGRGVDYYRIGVRQFEQDILPAGMGLGPTKVWSYGSVDHPETFNYPASRSRRRGAGRCASSGSTSSSSRTAASGRTCCRWTRRSTGPTRPAASTAAMATVSDHDPYRGPVPIVTHLHGGHSDQESDGYPEAWYLPKARHIPQRYARAGSKYQHVPGARAGRARPGVDTRQRRVPVRQRPARGDDVVPRPHARDDAPQRLRRAGRLLPAARRPDDAVGGTLPGPAPALGDPPGREYFEIPLAIQDRSFTDEGELFYPDNRAFFEGLDPSQLQIPFAATPPAAGRATSRRSGTRSSSATRSSSTGAPGPS